MYIYFVYTPLFQFNREKEGEGVKEGRTILFFLFLKKKFFEFFIFSFLFYSFIYLFLFYFLNVILRYLIVRHSFLELLNFFSVYNVVFRHAHAI